MTIDSRFPYTKLMSSNTDQTDESTDTQVTRRDILTGAAVAGVTITPGFLGLGEETNDLGYFDTHLVQNSGETLGVDPSPLNFGAGITATGAGDGGVNVSVPGSTLSEWSEDDSGTLSGPASDTDDLDIGGQDVQIALDGMVVPVGPDLGPEDAIDPANTTSPLQDATDAVAANGKGAVLLPPTSISEENGYNPARGISVIGWGRDVSVINFGGGATSDHGFLMNTQHGGTFATFDGFRISGPGDNTTSGIGWYVAEEVSNVTIGSIGINGWTNAAFRINSSYQPTAWRIGSIRCNNIDAAANDPKSAVINLGNTGPTFKFGTLYAMPSATTSASDSEIVYVDNNGELEIEQFNIGGTVNHALVQANAERGVTIGQVNLEPSGKQSTSASAFKLTGAGPTDIGLVRLTGTGVDHNYVYRIVNSSPGNKEMGRVYGTGAANTNIVAVATDLAASCVYHGDSADVANNTGATLTNPVSCLGDLTKAT